MNQRSDMAVIKSKLKLPQNRGKLDIHQETDEDGSTSVVIMGDREVCVISLKLSKHLLTMIRKVTVTQGARKSTFIFIANVN
jgi:hypothetical protein